MGWEENWKKTGKLISSSYVSGTEEMKNLIEVSVY